MPRIGKKPLAVAAADLADLRASGITDATIRRNRLKTEDDALHFPYRDLAGEVNGFTRWKPHKPRTKDGKPIKYEQAKNTKPRAYFPTESVKKLNDNRCPIFITEGEKKALALSQLDTAAVGIGGVYCWKKKGTDKLIDDLQEIEWTGRDVYLVFDFDEKPKTRRKVAAAGRRLAKALRLAGAREVFWVELPPAADGGKQGIDDLLVTHGEKRFKELIDVAAPVPSADIPSLTTDSGRTDAANAKRLILHADGRTRWVGAWDKWLIWDGKRWSLDQQLRIEALAKEVAARLWEEISAHVIDGIDKQTLGYMCAFARTSSGANGIRNMVALARSELGVSIDIQELDTDPWLLNVENGTINLNDGTLREHCRDDLLTKLAPVTFDPDARCPMWTKFLRTIFAGNKDLIGYVQRLVGYSLTGVTEEHILPFLYGIGANGKTTLVETILKLLGPDYAMKAPPDLLMAKRGETHPTERADLFGKRLVACVETEDGRRLAEALVKELTGGDRVRARRMREDFWEFSPTHHVWLAGNYRPIITGTDHGIWRRIKLIPFEVVIANADQDKKLPHKLAGELSGILNWAIEGCLAWQRDGLGEPQRVQTATKKYSSEMDEVGQFIKDCCELGPKFTAPATELYDRFQAATKSRMSQRSFGESLHRRGYESDRVTSGRHKGRKCWRGLRLIELAELEQLGDAALALATKNSKKKTKGR